MGIDVGGERKGFDVAVLNDDLQLVHIGARLGVPAVVHLIRGLESNGHTPTGPYTGDLMPALPAATEPTAPTSTPLPQTGNGDGAGVDSASEAGGQSRIVGLVLFLILLVVGVAFLIAFFDAVRHWLALHTGTLHGGPDLYYNFWSGFGSDLGEATLITAVGIGVYTGVRKVNCHTKGCWRIGHHPLDGTPYILCRHHHPDVPTKGASHEHILEQHRKYKEAKEAREALGS